MAPSPKVFLTDYYAKFSSIAKKIKVKKAAFADMLIVKGIYGQGAGQAGVFKLNGIAVQKLIEGKAGRDRGVKSADLFIATPPVLVSRILKLARPEPHLFAR
jgi:hypothetical protein